MKEFRNHQFDGLVNIDVARELIMNSLDWSWPHGGMWTTSTEVAKHVGLPDVRASSTAVGLVLSSMPGVKHKRTAANRLVFVPRPAPVAETETLV